MAYYNRIAQLFVALLLSLAGSASADTMDGPACNWPFVQRPVILADANKIVIDRNDGDPSDNRFRVRIGAQRLDAVSQARRTRVEHALPIARVRVSQLQGAVSMSLSSRTGEPSWAAGGVDTSINAGCWYWSAPPAVFDSNSQGLRFNFDMQVPFASTTGPHAAVMAGLNLMFVERAAHRPSGKTFWVSIVVFDLRRSIATWHAVQPDTSRTTDAAIAGSSIDVPGWFHKGKGSSGFQSRPDSIYRHYAIKISLEEFRQILEALKAKDTRYSSSSSSPGDWRLLHFNVGPEVHYPEALGRARIKIQARNMLANTY